MDRTPSPDEKRTAPRPRRRTLEDFPCIDDVSHCHEGCDGWPDNACAVGIVYKEYLELQSKALAYKRCARLLGLIDRWWGTIGQWRRRGEVAKWRRLRCYMRSALREAGL